MKKTFLLSYKLPKFLILADWIDYKLEVEIVWFWGLFKTQKEIEYRIYNHQNAKSFYDHWDNIIKNKLSLQ